MKQAGGRIPRSVRNMHFVLSESSPIRVTVDCYSSTHIAPLFDIHYEMELGVVLSGRMRRVYKGFETVCRPGDVWLCGMWEPHGYAVETVPCKVMVFVIWPPLLAGLRMPEYPDVSWMELFALPPCSRPKSTPAVRAAAMSAARRILAALKKDSALAKVRIRLVLIELLSELMERAPSGKRPRPPAASGIIYERISRAIEEVFQCRRRISTPQAAAACGMGPEKFRREFKRAMGMSFSKFALQHRVAMAAEQLSATDKPIKRVAFENGFSNESHLTRVFLTHYSCTPAEYRRRCARLPQRR